jgi:hypothetical protein
VSEKIKTDYLKFIFHKANTDLTRYSISRQDKELVNKLFERIISSDNLPRDLYILSHTKELSNIGKYFIFILKKMEDRVINFDNLSQNLKTDLEFIENEILNYLSNPKLREITEFKNENEPGENVERYTSKSNLRSEERSNQISEESIEEVSEDEGTEEKEITNFKKSYLELIQSDETNDENVYELPNTDAGKVPEESDLVFELPVIESGKAEETIIEDEKISESVSGEEGDSFLIKGEAPEEASEGGEEEPSEKSLFDAEIEISGNTEEELPLKNYEDNQIPEDEKIQLSEEIQEEISSYESEHKNSDSEKSIFEEEQETQQEAEEEPQASVFFLEYETEVTERNEYLNKEFERMIDPLNGQQQPDEEREGIIRNILETSRRLEGISRKMSLEIISNIYQTIIFSFEKISEGKYDITQSTLNLFKNGLSLVISLIRGDDYFGYKDILKSIENIRNALMEEKEKRELYLRQKQEKLESERKISQKYPEESQRIKIISIKQLIKETETNFNNLENISGEYQIYEALRSLSGNLNNFKDIVKLSKELNMKKMVQLSEASYIFTKFLQNYRINPVTIEIKEIFGYIIYNLKSLIVDKEVKDVDLFISYLNDPVKIFSKTDKKKPN